MTKKPAVLDWSITDAEGLNDYQKRPAPGERAIDRVGVNRFRIPISYQVSPADRFQAIAEMEAWVSLPAGRTGVNMSRLVEIAQDYLSADEALLSFSLLSQIAGEFRSKVNDYPGDKSLEISKEKDEAFISLSFSLASRQKSLKSQKWGWQIYPCSYSVKLTGQKNILLFSLDYEYSSVCPCSLSMAKQYEHEFRLSSDDGGQKGPGAGIAAAHGQRSIARVELELESESFYPLELIKLLREIIPTETQALAKRIDEREFAILNGANPLFVEDACRKIADALDSERLVAVGAWRVEVEHFESLHSHNAKASLEKYPRRTN